MVEAKTKPWLNSPTRHQQTHEHVDHLKDVLPEGLEESLPAIAQLEKALDAIDIDPEPEPSTDEV